MRYIQMAFYVYAFACIVSGARGTYEALHMTCLERDDRKIKEYVMDADLAVFSIFWPSLVGAAAVFSSPRFRDLAECSAK